MLVEKWNEIKLLMESLDVDVTKNAKGNSSAGVRARRGLRLLKAMLGEYSKLTIQEEKAKRGEE
jgi:hypothetical protein